MSDRKKDEDRDSRDEDERKKPKTAKPKPGNASKSEIDDLSKLIRKHTGQSTAESRRRRSESDSDASDSKESRFKTPPAKKKRSTTPSAPRKGKEASARIDTSDEGSGDDVHRRSKRMLEIETRDKSKARRNTQVAAADCEDEPTSETIKELKKVIANQQKKTQQQSQITNHQDLFRS